MDIKAKTFDRHLSATSNPGAVAMTAGGVARNIAHNLGMLGADVRLLTVFGHDTGGDMLLAHTTRAHVDMSHCLRVNGNTGTYVAILGSTGELISAVSDMSLMENLDVVFVAKNVRLFEEAEIVVADCNLNIATLNAIAEICADRLVVEPVSLSKCQKLLRLLDNRPVFLATPNRAQIEALTGTLNIEKACAILHEKGLKNIVIHAGEDGAFVSDGQKIETIMSCATKIIDVTGAGDAATAGLIMGLVQNLPLIKAAMFGQEISARVIASNASTLD